MKYFMSKRGQVAIIIVAGMLILGAVVLVLYLKSSALEERGETAAQAATTIFSSDTVHNFVASCLQKTGKEVLFRNGRSGGYFILPAAATKGLQENAPLYAIPGQQLTPSDDTLAKEISRGVDALLSICFNEFNAFREQGFAIEAGQPSTTALLSPTGVQLKTAMPVRMVRDDEEKTISEFVAFVDAPRWHQAKTLAEKVAQSVTGPFICLDCFANETEKAGVYVGVLPLSNNQYLFDIKDEEYQHDAAPYHLRFAVAYDPAQPLPEEEEGPEEIEEAGEANAFE